MNKSSIVIVILIVLLFLFGIVSFRFTNNNYEQHDEGKVIIDNLELDVEYITEKNVNISLTYGNMYENVIKLKNSNDKDIAYSLVLNDLYTTSTNVETYIYVSNNNSDYILLDSYKYFSKYLDYNLNIKANSVIYIKFMLKAMSENTTTDISGSISVEKDVSEKEKFLSFINDGISTLNNKINAINGINEAGFYIIDVNLLNSQLNGYVVIDASDIAELKHYLYVYYGNLKVDGVKYNLLNSAYIEVNEELNLENTFNKESIAEKYSNCKDFEELHYEKNGGRKNFYNDTSSIIKSVKKINNLSSKIYVVDVTSEIENNTNVRGYILIDNTNSEKEYYIYLTNDIFMISGYNISKYGMYTYDSSTIRAYVESAFELSSSNKLSVCNFSGFNECYDLNGNLLS